jgi:hypothetical protein
LRAAEERRLWKGSRELLASASGGKEFAGGSGEKLAAQGELLGAMTVGEEAEVTDALEAVG